MLRAGWYEKQVSKTGIIYRACAAERSILYITMQAARHAARQLVQRGATQMKSVRGMASDASSEKAHYEEAMKEMSKWCVGIMSLKSDGAGCDCTTFHLMYTQAARLHAAWYDGKTLWCYS